MPSSRPNIHVWRPPKLDGIELQWCHEVSAEVPAHFHDGHQVGLIESGTLDVRVADRATRAGEGDIVLLDAGVAHAMTSSEQAPVTAIVIEIGQARMRRCLDLSEDDAPPRFSAAVVRDEAAADAMRDLHRRLADECADVREDAVEQLSPLVCHLMVEHGLSRPDGLDTIRAEAIDEVRRYLDDHLGERLALDQLAESAGASKFQLVRCFKRRVGLPPLSYQLQRRVNRSKELLAAGMPIADVAFELGFADQSHLTRHFKRLTLMTPGDYQRGQRPADP